MLAMVRDREHKCTGHYSVYKMMEVKDVWLLFDL